MILAVVSPFDLRIDVNTSYQINLQVFSLKIADYITVSLLGSGQRMANSIGGVEIQQHYKTQ